MKKPLIIMLLAAAAVWSCTMAVHNARATAAAEEPDVTAPSWEIRAFVVDNKDPEHKAPVGKYATDQKTIDKFPTEAACKEFLKTDKTLARRIASGSEKTAKWKPPAHIELVCTVDNSV